MEVVGDEVVVANFRRVAATIDAAQKDISAGHGKTLEYSARAKARKLTGLMASSIRSRPTEAGVDVLAGGGAADYTPVQYYGSPARGITPNPFLSDALIDNEAKIVRDEERGIGEHLRKVWVNTY